jgi:hypothetical protein
MDLPVTAVIKSVICLAIALKATAVATAAVVVMVVLLEPLATAVVNLVTLAASKYNDRLNKCNLTCMTVAVLLVKAPSVITVVTPDIFLEIVINLLKLELVTSVNKLVTL